MDDYTERGLKTLGWIIFVAGVGIGMVILLTAEWVIF